MKFIGFQDCINVYNYFILNMKMIKKIGSLNQLVFKSYFCILSKFKFNTMVQLVENVNQSFEYVKPIEKPVNIPLWSHSYFNLNSKLVLPIIDLKTQTYTNKNVCLPHDIFNNPIRRDLIHRVFYYNECFNKKSTKTTKNKGTAKGSGIKPFKQKGTGRARQGNKRSPINKGGGHVFSLSPKEYYFKLNKKIRLLALKSLLSYKFLDKKIIVIKNFNNIESLEGVLEKNSAVIFCSNSSDKINLEKKSLNINFSTNLNVQILMKNTYVVFTQESLETFCQTNMERQTKYYRLTKKFKNVDSLKEHEMTNINYEFDPFKVLDLKTPAFKGSYKTILASKIYPEKLINNAFKDVEQKLEKRTLQIKERIANMKH